MGITIHYTIRFNGTRKELLASLDSVAKKFKKMNPDIEISRIIETGRIVEKKGEFLMEASRKLREKYPELDTDQLRWFMIQSFGEGGYNGRDIVGFSTLIMEGCEPFNLPFVADKTKENSWIVKSFTKTQYARDFLKAHVTVCSLLETIKKENSFEIEVHDESGYYESHDFIEMNETKKQMDIFINSIGISLKKMFEGTGIDVKMGNEK